MSKRTAQGFTLIELMTVVVIIGILFAIVTPIVQGYIQRGRRAEAVSLIGEMQTRLERWRAENASYTVTDGQAGFGAFPTATYYSVALSNATATGYTLTATASGPQTRDTACKVMSVTYNSGTTTKSPATGCF